MFGGPIDVEEPFKGGIHYWFLTGLADTIHIIVCVYIKN